MSERYLPHPESQGEARIAPGLRVVTQREPLGKENLERLFQAYCDLEDLGERTVFLEELKNRLNDALENSLFFSEIKTFKESLEEAADSAYGDFQLLLKASIERVASILGVLERPLPVIRQRAEAKRSAGADRITDRELSEYLSILNLDLELLLKERILDIGAGEVLFTSEFSREVSQRKVAGGGAVYALDLGPGDFLREADRHQLRDPFAAAKRKRIQERLSELANIAVVGDWHNLPFADRSFDRVVSVFAFPYWVESWRSFRTDLAEILRVLKKGGTANLYPGAPVLTPADLNQSTRRLYDKEPILYNLWHRPEYEEIIKELTEKASVGLSLKTAWPHTVSPAVYLVITLP